MFADSCAYAQHFNQGEIRTLTGPLNNFHSFLFQLFHCRFTVVSGNIAMLMTNFSQNSAVQTDDLTFDATIIWFIEDFKIDSMDARLLSAVAAKKAQIT